MKVLTPYQSSKEDEANCCDARDVKGVTDVTPIKSNPSPDFNFVKHFGVENSKKLASFNSIEKKSSILK